MKGLFQIITNSLTRATEGDKIFNFCVNFSCGFRQTTISDTGRVHAKAYHRFSGLIINFSLLRDLQNLNGGGSNSAGSRRCSLYLLIDRNLFTGDVAFEDHVCVAAKTHTCSPHGLGDGDV